MSTLTASTEKPKAFSLSMLGPGIMVAAAAIGGSHLVASTQAGALYGWQLAGLIILVNLMKYPFFHFAVRYTAATDESLLAGYRRLGKGWLSLFMGLNFFAGVVNIAALLGLSGALLTWVVPGVAPSTLAIVAGALSMLIVLKGHYSAVDGVCKFIVLALSILTVAAAILAFTNIPPANVVEPVASPWTLASLGFLISLMGWMPAPVEISAMNSLWNRSKSIAEGKARSVKVAIMDLNIGYVVTSILALVFLSLGAQVIYGHGIELATSGAAFTKQLANMYAEVMGDWSRWLVIIAALFCIYSSALTCVDGYSRVARSAYSNLSKDNDDPNTESPLVVTLVTLTALGIILFFPGTIMTMLKFAMIAAFLTTPVFAWMNYKLVVADHMPEDDKPSLLLKAWGLTGLAFLSAFTMLFIVWQFFMQ